MARISKLFSIIFLIYVLKCTDSSACINQNPCLCEIDEYNRIDLTGISQTLKIDEWLEDEDAHGNSFYFHGCKDGEFNATIHHIKINTTTLYSGSLIHANVTVNNASVEVNGKSAEIKISPIDGEKDSYQLVYRRGENVTARIRLLCTKFSDSFIKILSTDGPNPSLALSSPYACMVTYHPGLSTGSILLIMFFISIGVYFIGGCVILYFVRGARGVEMIPNIDFWRSLPGLVKDGIIFLFSGCNPNAISTPETYDRI